MGLSMILARCAGPAVIVAIAAVILSACPENRSGPATVTVLDGTPVEGVQVVFHNPDGSVHARAVTGADGKATAVVVPGAMATVARSFPGGFFLNSYALITVAGLEPGDDVVASSATPTVVQMGEVTVTLPGAYPGAIGYRLDIGCNVVRIYSQPADVPVTIPVLSPCGATISALAVAFDSRGDIAYSAAADVTLSGTPPALTGSIALPAWRTDFGSLAFTVHNVPAGEYFRDGELQLRRNGVRFVESTPVGTTAPAEPTTLTLPFALGLGGSARLRAYYYRYSAYPSGWGLDGVETWIANDIDPFMPLSLDLASLPPRLSAPIMSGTPGAPAVSWTSEGTDPSLDAQFLEVVWTDTSWHQWNVMLPPESTSFAFPQLPADLSAWLPPQGIEPTASIEAVDVSTVAGYAAFKVAYSTSFPQALPENGAYTVRATTGLTPVFVPSY